MITAEHWVNQQFSKQIISEDIYASKQGIIEAMVIFAKLHVEAALKEAIKQLPCLLYTSPSPRDRQKSRMPSSA